MLLAAAALDGEAYGLTVRNLLRDEAGRAVSMGAVHATLYRLEEKGFLRSELKGASSSRGGRRKRIFVPTGSGMAMLEEAQRARDRLRALVPGAMRAGLAS